MLFNRRRADKDGNVTVPAANIAPAWRVDLLEAENTKLHARVAELEYALARTLLLG